MVHWSEDPTKHFQNVDADGSGEISFEEWAAVFGQDSRFQPYLRLLFDELDVDLNGSVSYNEFIDVIEADLVYGTPWLQSFFSWCLPSGLKCGTKRRVHARVCPCLSVSS